MYLEQLKGHGYDFIKIFFFLFLLFTMLQESSSNDHMKFGSQSLCYKQDTELTTLCHVNKAHALFLFTLFQYTSAKLIV